MTDSCEEITENMKCVIEGVSTVRLDSITRTREEVRGGGNGVVVWQRAGGAEACCSALYKLRTKPYIYAQKEALLSGLLSIMADCCEDWMFRMQIGENDISQEIVYILKNETSDEILNRTCRLIGNMCQSFDNAEQFHSSAGVNALIKVLTNTNLQLSILTTNHIIRAIRALWSVRNSQKDMLQANIIRVVATIFCEQFAHFSTPISQQTIIRNTEIDNLRSNLLKCIEGFTSHPSKFVLQINGNGHGFEYLVNSTEYYKALALPCILNLCKVEDCRSLLGIAGAISLLVNLLHSQPDYTYMKALCLLCYEPLNRSKLVDLGGLTLLLKMFKNVSELKCHLYALETLLQFYFDSDALKMLVDKGAISIFVELAKGIVNGADHQHMLLQFEDSGSDDQSHSERMDEYYQNLRTPNLQSCKRTTKRLKSGFSDVEKKINLKRLPLSNDPTCSYCGFNLKNGTIFNNNETVSKPQTTRSSYSSFSPASTTSSNISSVVSKYDEDANVLEIYEFRMHGLFSLLYIFTFISTGIIVKMASQDCIYTLLNFIETSRRPAANNRAVKILQKLFSDYLCFDHVLRHSVIFRLYHVIQNRHHRSCKRCQEISTIYDDFYNKLKYVSQSGYIVGMTTHQLIKSDFRIKQLFSVTLPFVITSPSLLKKYYITHDALELFMNTLSAKEELFKESVIGLKKMATSLNIPAPKLVVPLRGHVQYIYIPNCNEDDEVTFVLDDSSTVRANAKVLCEYSDVFETMLHGEFAEAQQKQVKLQKVSKQGLEYLLVLVEPNVRNSLAKTIPVPRNLNIILETLMLTDRFLMTDLKKFIFDAIIQYFMNYLTVSEIYTWSLQDGVGTLYDESLAYILVGNMTDDQRCTIVSGILKNVHKQQWIDDVKQRLTRSLEASPSY